MITLFGKTIKSATEIDGEKIKAVIARYEQGQACSKSNDGILFLQQQRSETVIRPTTLSVKEIRELCEDKKIKFKDGYENRVKSYIASDESVDSYGDIIMQNGWDLKDRFKNNPAIMWSHDYYSPNIGSGLKAKIDRGESSKLLIDVLFMDADIYPFADTAFKMVDSGFLKGGSVGFIPTKITEISDDEERSALGLGKWGVVFEKQTLLEFSVTPLGANKNALVQNSLFAEAARKGIISKDELERIKKDDNKDTRVSDSMREMMDKALSMIGDKTFSIPQPETKKVIAYKKYPLEDEAAEWDGGKEVSAADTEDLKIMCTWFDADNPDEKGSYKLPHHVQDGYATNWKAVANAMARLMQTNLPEGERQGVYNHLSKHYADFGKEPPEFGDLKSLADAMQKIGIEWQEEIVDPKSNSMAGSLPAAIETIKDHVSQEIKALLQAIKDQETVEGGIAPSQPTTDVYHDLFSKAKSINQTLSGKE